MVVNLVAVLSAETPSSSDDSSETGVEEDFDFLD